MADDEARRRRLALLDSYYLDDEDEDQLSGGDDGGEADNGDFGGGGGGGGGDKGKKKLSLEATFAPASTVDPREKWNIDSAHFDPDGYLASVMHDSALTSLIAKRNEVVAEVRTLDVDMQMLVYENYEKFISATDTIRDMKTNMEGMESEVVRLAESMDRIAETSGAVETGLADGRARIEHLTGIRRLLKKIEFLFQLPSRLKRSVELGAHAQAVKYYSISNRALRRYSDIASFKAIQEEADAIIGGLRETLRATLEGGETPHGSTNTNTNNNNNKGRRGRELAETVTLLLKLEEPADKLRGSYIEKCAASMRAALEEARRSGGGDSGGGSDPAGAAGDEDDGKSQDMASPLLHTLSQRFITPWDEFARSYRQLFLLAEGGGPASDGSSAEANRQLAECATSLFDVYFEIVTTRVGGVISTGNGNINSNNTANGNSSSRTLTTASVEDVVASLSLVATDVARAHRYAPQADLLGKGKRVIESLLRETAQTAMRAVTRDTVVPGLSALSGTCDLLLKGGGPAAGSPEAAGGNDPVTQLGDGCARLATDLVSAVKGGLDSLAPLARAAAPCRDRDARPLSQYARMVTSTVHAAAASVVTDLLELLERLSVESASEASGAPEIGTDSGSLAPLPFVPSLAIGAVAARLAMHLETTAVRKMSSAVNAAFPSEDDTTPFSLPELMSASHALGPKVYPHLLGALSLSISRSLRAGVDSIEWHRVSKEPTNVRVGGIMVAEEVGGVAKVIGALFGNATPSGPSSHRGSVSAPPIRGARAIESGIERLFAKKVSLLGGATRQPVFETGPLVGAVVSSALKTYVESVRLRTFSRCGLQRTQVDVHYLRLALRVHVDDPAVIDGLLDEVVTSCTDRCVEPVPLDSGIVDALVQRRLEKSR